VRLAEETVLSVSSLGDLLVRADALVEASPVPLALLFGESVRTLN
jgi:hypothetical protein